MATRPRSGLSAAVRDCPSALAALGWLLVRAARVTAVAQRPAGLGSVSRKATLQHAPFRSEASTATMLVRPCHRVEPVCRQPCQGAWTGPARGASCARRRAQPVACAKRNGKDVVKQSHKAQLQSTELLAKLIESGDPASTAQRHVDSLTEEFFIMSSTYMEMARKEGNKEVVEKLESVLRVAMTEKKKTLRPEIQLLNTLLEADTTKARQETLKSSLAKDVLMMNEEYFSKLLARMTSDVAMQPESPSKSKLMEKLADINVQISVIGNL